MRIAFAGPVPPFRGGIAQHAARTIESLGALGHDVSVHSWASQYPRRLYPGEERVEGLEPLPGARFAMRWWAPWTWWATGRAMRSADLVVLPWVTPFQGPAYGTLLRAARRVPAVGIVHNPLPHERRRVDETLTRLVLPRLRGAVVHAQDAARTLERVAPGVRTVVVPMPPTLPLTATPLPLAPPYRLLFIGFVRPYKGLDVAIEAVAALRAGGHDVQLTVAGEFWGSVEPYRDQIGALRLDGQVTLRPGYVPDREIASLLASHHVVVAPYRSATQSAIVPLAHAAGRPVVATAVGGLPEVIEDGVTGVLAVPDDAPSFAAAVGRALDGLSVMADHAAGAAPHWSDVARAVLDAGTER